MGGERSAIVRHLSSNPQPIQRQSFSSGESAAGLQASTTARKVAAGRRLFLYGLRSDSAKFLNLFARPPREDAGREDHCNSIAGSGHALSARRMCRRLTSDDWRCSKAVRSYEKCQPKRPDQDPQEVEDAGAWSVIPLG